MSVTVRAKILILMGVSGCGKSTIARLLADELGWPLLEGDEFHSLANIAKMRGGVPLSDTDRLPWLDAIAGHLAQWRGAGGAGIVTCSALKRRYRARLVAECKDAWFVYLKGSPDLIRSRLVKRLGHFMPVNLLDSQFAALEEPESGERAITISVAGTPPEIAGDIVSRIPYLA